MFFLCRIVMVAQAIYTHLSASDGLSDNRVMSMMQLPDGRMAVTTDGCLNIYDGNKFRHFRRNTTPSMSLSKYNGHYHLYTDCERRLWIKDWQRVWCLDLNRENFITDYDSLRHIIYKEKDIEDLFVDTENRHVWIVNGDEVVDSNTGLSFLLPKECGSLLDLDVHDGHVYMFTSDGAVTIYKIQACLNSDVTKNSHFDTSKGRNLEKSKSSNQDLVNPKGITSPSSEGSHTTSMITFDPATRSFLQIRTTSDRSWLMQLDTRTRRWKTLLTTDYTLHTIVLKSPGTAYITSARGLWIVDAKSGNVSMDTSYAIAVEDKIDLDLNTLYFDTHDGLWLGSTRQGIIYTHPSRARFHSIRSHEKVEYVHSALPLYSGLRIYTSFTDSKGNIWHGLTDGLALIRTGKPDTIFYTEDGLSGNAVHSLVEDSKGRIWAGTCYGITCISTDGQGKLVLTPYHPLDGTLENEYVDNGATLLSDGTIRMEGMDGTTIFHPDSVTLTPKPLDAELVQLTIDGKTTHLWNGLALSLADSIILQHDYKSLSLVFSSFNYALPEHTTYKYRLIHGRDTLWTTIVPMNGGNGLLTLSYDNLKAGNYTLQVMSGMGNGETFGKVRKLHIIILPPWWQTMWAYIIYVLLSIIIVSFCVWAVTKYREDKMKRKYREDMLLTRIRTLMEAQQEYENSNEIDTSSMQDVEDNSQKEINSEVSVQSQMSDSDRAFLAQAIEKVEANITTPGYTVERLAQDMCMERTGLYKRLTQILDQTPSLFIRSIKLRHAATLLSTTSMTVVEIAEMTGFSSSSHLSRLFHEEYGCKPLEYRQKSTSVS